MRVIGLTGPIAAGKDEAAAALKKIGALVIDADEIAHSLYQPQSSLWHELVKAFGSKILMRGGKLNRHKLGEIVFSDKEKLQQLNKLVHPLLKEQIVKILESRKLLPQSRQKTVVINAAVLKEIGLIPLVDEVWVVMASRESRIKRLFKSGLAKEEAARHVSIQASQKEYLALADRVINNDGTLKQLHAKIQAHLQV
ncbi:dephospho-CoA kinase [candidate division WOR-1 bacterium RIFCSPHIGHO2_01_FULL_53_15]|uniref:Dephospho-CoA kinase n=1 Tax=candidate division WOR-1 bacterium RIFCSPHIGHO2_01_FULL_53_15 TaxID=1802564 RepID=A0A1F4Q0H8_UNCSA|nr:MAG: dephospho-CoA kinase [candidate division WOR-1 bacterium RIFCSPHIGHO2_01_FULL_53_15]OGC12623.1 MAG: dephospho-CoA kinase [candidate division WOR-1 bacterium RIFCSPHIGHO2_02_FULL_53_26]